MIVVGPAATRYADHSAGRPAVLGIKAARFHLNFLNELRRLRSLGLIESAPGKGVRMLEREGGDVGDYFTVTPRGQEYLRLRAETKDSD